MRENPYKRLPPIERKQDGSLYRMTPAQRKQANALIRRECCCYDNGNCIALDDGDTCTCPQTISFSVCCKWFRWAVLPLTGTLEAEIYRDRDLKHCAAGCSLQSPTEENTAPTAPPEFTGGRKQKVNGKGGLLWTVRQEKALIYRALQAHNRGGWYQVSTLPENELLTVHKTHYDKHDLYSSAGKGYQLHPAPEFPL